MNRIGPWLLVPPTVRTKEDDGQAPNEPSAIAQIIVKVYAGVADQNIERFDVLDSP
jgi:hypothetical protein